MINLYQNKTPFYELISGASIAFAALLLIIPGFFTDLIGFFLLIPFTRQIIFKLVTRNQVNIKEERKRKNTIDGEIVDKKSDEL